MTRLSMAVLAIVATFAVVLAVGPLAEAQGVSRLDTRVVAAATAVVDATVVSTHAVELDGLPYTVAELAVSGRIVGNVQDTVFVIVKGGTLATGTRVFAGHEPILERDDVLELALAPAEGHMPALIEAATGASSDVAFVIVGGEAGVADRSLTGASFAGARDYVLNGATWRSFTPPATFKINPSGAPVGNTAAINAIQRAAAQWENDAASSIDLHYAGTTNRTGVNLSDGVNTITFRNDPASGALANTWWHPLPNGQFTFDIEINTHWLFGDRSGGAATWYDLETTVLHELGHVIGLGHAGAPNDGIRLAEIMDEHIPARTSKGLAAGDRAGINRLYSASSCDGRTATVDLTLGIGVPTSGDDVIVGTSGADTIDGRGGDDIICGLGGNDTISGGSGNDRIWGGDGVDRIYGNSGHDLLNGQAGNDRLFGGTSGDTLYGLGGQDFLSGGGGWDTIYGHGADDTIYGGSGSDTIHGGSGNDIVHAGFGADRAEGGDGDDQVHGDRGIDSLIGGTGNDDLHGGTGPDLIWGGPGADTLNGEKGADRLYGQAGNDELNGDGGWDHLDGGAATDTCRGGFGQDTALACEIAESTP